MTGRDGHRRTAPFRHSDSGSTTGREADINPLRRPADIDPLNECTHEGCWRDGVTIRIARPTDRPALLRLAELDCARIPNDVLMVAEVNGRIVAAVCIAQCSVIADPFSPTAELVELLRLAAEQFLHAQS